MQMLKLHTAVIGSGAAGLNAASRLYDYGVTDVAIFTEGLRKGTSRNTGSDKQTYYKLSMAGDGTDSPRAMAETLFSGGCMDGDIALAEAAMSAECFYRLCIAAVPFPHNEYGEYVGYQTDHDQTVRATSAGPLTSRIMYEKLLEEVYQREIPVFDHIQLIRILVKEEQVIGFLGLDLAVQKEDDKKFVLVHCSNVILATGGPAGLYQMSAYPPSQIGSTGVALEAGALGKNLTEWQYGIASLGFRWNLSGTYQQVIPRYLSTDQNGRDERDFLAEAFPDPEKLLEAIFLKGYQWPFDPAKIKAHGSSLIDLLVYRETVVRGRRVFLDYKRNPPQMERDGNPCFEKAGTAARGYLQQSGALKGTPVERLMAMNLPAYELYASHGTDLKKKMLEIGICAQHNNGGLAGDDHWESNLKHLFPVGEVNGTHGVARPGGSALNSGQVGGLQAARKIRRSAHTSTCSEEEFLEASKDALTDMIGLCDRLCSHTGISNSLD